MAEEKTEYKEDYLKYCNHNKIDDGLLRNFLYIKRYGAAREQIKSAIEHHKSVISALETLDKKLHEHMTVTGEK